MKYKVIKFAISFMQHRNYRSVIKHVKNELPGLLGFTSAEVFLLDGPNRNLYCMSVRPDEVLHDSEEGKGRSFENDFIVNEERIVRFPTNMGVSGYALRGDAVCYINDFASKQA